MVKVLFVILSIANGAPRVQVQPMDDYASCVALAETYNQVTAEDKSTVGTCLEFKGTDA